MRRVRVTPIAKIAGRGKFKEWMAQRDNQSGLSAAGQVLLEGAQDDPYKALAQSVGAFFGARNQDRRRMEEEGKQEELLAYERERQAKKDARDEEEFGLKKASFEAQAAAEAERRALAEEQRAKLKEHWGSLSPEEQRLFGPFVNDPKAYYDLMNDRGDDQRQQAQFEAELAEKKRRNSVDEKHDAARIGLDRERNQITREGQQMRGAKNKIVVSKGFVSVISPEGEVLSSTQLPADPAAAEREVNRVMVGSGLTAEEAFAQTKKVKELIQGEKADPSGGVTDESTAKEIEALKAEGLSDEDIIAMATPAERERVRRLLGFAMPRR